MDRPELAHFLFPGVKRIRSYGYLSMDCQVLYEMKTGERINDVEAGICQCFTDYIIVTSIPQHAVDVSLETKEDYINFLCNTVPLKKAKDIERRLPKIGDEDFVVFIKMTVALRRWYREIFESHEKVYNLFEAMLKSSRDFISLYLEMRLHMSHAEIFSAIVTFMLRLKNRDEQKDMYSDYYKRLTRAMKVQAGSPEKRLMDAVKLPREIPVENKCLGFYLSLR